MKPKWDKWIAAIIVAAGSIAGGIIVFRDYYLSQECPACECTVQDRFKYCPWCGLEK